MLNAESDDIATLISGLRSHEKEKRAEYTGKIVRAGKSAVKDLIPLLHDNDWKVRYRSSEALGLIGSPDAVPHLISACTDGKDHVRYMAVKSLGLIKSPEAVQMIIRLLDDEHPYTRGMASESLAAILDRRGIDALESAISRESIPELKERMAKNLCVLKNVY